MWVLEVLVGKFWSLTRARQAIYPVLPVMLGEFPPGSCSKINAKYQTEMFFFYISTEISLLASAHRTRTTTLRGDSKTLYYSVWSQMSSLKDSPR